MDNDNFNFYNECIRLISISFLNIYHFFLLRTFKFLSSSSSLNIVYCCKLQSLSSAVEQENLFLLSNYILVPIIQLLSLLLSS
jgi:hypothetical protein